MPTRFQIAGLAALGLATAMHAASPAHSAAPSYPDRTAAILEAKTYPLLAWLEKNTAAQTAVSMRGLSATNADRISDALSHCKDNACITSRFKISVEEEASAGKVLATLYANHAAFRTSANHLLASGVYPVQKDADGLRAALKADIDGINKTIAVYGEGAAPAYPKIDALEFDPAGKEFRGLLRAATIVAQEETKPGDLFFAPSMRFALSLLRISGREDAARFEPMDKGMNAAALTRIRTTTWSKYPYSAILVPGIGPDIVGQAISPLGQLHVALAAARYRAGKAPFVILSGGSVHPAHTHFVEAEEMRRELIDRYGIPASAVLIEPHARHTTTNLRNAVREIVHYGMPADKPVLIVCNENQTGMIANAKFAERNQRELGYLPWLTLKRLGRTDLEFTPNKDSLRVDGTSPLDP